MCGACASYSATPSGSATICAGNSADITFTFSGGTAPYDVVWTEGTLNGIPNGHNVSVAPPVTTTYTITNATDANGCDATPSGSVVVTVNDVIDLGPVAGNVNVCSNQSTTYSVQAMAGVTSYNWSVPGGANITFGQGSTGITVNWNGAASGDVCAVAVNSCGSGMPSCTAVSVTPFPVQPDPIIGPVQVCAGNQSTFTIPDVVGATDYTWSVPAYATLISGQGTTEATVLWNSAGTGNVCVVASNSCGAGPQRCLSVTTSAQPVSPTITGNFSPCQNTTGSYSVNAQPAVDSYQWSAPSGANIISGQGSSAVTIDWSGATPGVGSLCVDAISSLCNVTVTNCQDVDVLPLPEAPASITGEETVCVGDSKSYTIDPVNGATSYNWTVPAGAIILSGNGTTEVTIRWNTASTGNVCVRAQNTCGNSTYTCLPVTAVGIPTNPVFTAGNFSPCENATLNYGVTPQAAFDNYSWNYDNGGNIIAGDGTPAITMDWAGAGNGNLCVTASSTVCNVSRQTCKPFTIKLLPGLPEYESSDDVLCAGDTGTYVLIPVPGATFYNWGASGGVFIGNSTGSAVKIKWPSQNLVTMEVSAGNGCGQGPILYAPTVLVDAAPPQPGAVSGPATVCQGSTQTYSIAAVPGAMGYTWEVPAGASILSGQGTVSATVKFNSLGTGSVCVRAKSTLCESPATCRSVTVAVPAGTPGGISGASTVCQSSTVVYSIAPVPGATGYAWTLPPGASLVSGGNTPAITVSFAGASSGQICVAAVSGCGNSVSSCLAITVGTSLTPSISGPGSFCTGGSALLDAGAGYATYIWSTAQTGQTITVSSPGTYSVTVTAAGGCSGSASKTVTESAALTPSIAGPTGICPGGSAILDAGTGYSSYTWSGNQSGQAILINGAGAYTVTVSDAGGCTGTDTHAVTQYTPPVPVISGPGSVCPGNQILLDAGAGYVAYLWSNVAATQTSPVTDPGVYTVTVTDANGCTGTDDQTVLPANPATPPVLNFSPDTLLCSGMSILLDAGNPSSTYQWNNNAVTQTLTVTSAGNYIVTVTNGCGQVTDSITVGYFAPIVLSNLASAGLNGSFILSGGVPETNGSNYVSVTMTLQGNATVTANLSVAPFTHGETVAFSAPQYGTYEVMVTDARGCTGLWPVTISPCTLTVDAGPDRSACPGQSVHLVASGGTSYQWSDGGPAAAQWTFIPAATKVYAVMATDTNGCAGVDSLTITVADTGPDCGLLAHYKLDGNGEDASGNGQGGVANGGLTWGLDRFGNCQGAAWLDGTNDFISVGVSAGLSAPTAAMTVAAWVLGPDSIPKVESIISNGTLLLVQYRFLIGSAKELWFSANTGGSAIEQGTPLNLFQPNQWNHYAVVYDGTSLKAYVNGNLAKQGLASGIITPVPGAVFEIGRDIHSQTEYLRGALDDIRVYDRALTDTEVFDLFAIADDTTNLFSANISAPDTAYCPGSTLALNASPAQTGLTYTWYLNGSVIPGATTSTFLAALPGSYQVRIASGPGCDTVSAAFAVSEHTLPVVQASSSDLDYCAGETIQLFCAGDGAIFSWSGPSGFNSAQQDPQISGTNPAMSGLYTVKADNDQGCTAMDTVEILVVPSPDAVITAPAGTELTCSNPAVTMTASGGDAFTWSDGLGTSANVVVTVEGSYGVTVTDGVSGCTDTASISVNNNMDVPTSWASGGVLDCNNSTVMLQGFSNTPGVAYFWTGPNNFTSSQQDPPVDQPGSYTFTVSAPNGCSSAATVDVTMNAAPPATITAGSSTTLCAGENVSLSAPVGSGYSYQWSNNGLPISGATTANYSATASGNYSVVVTENGCSATSTEIAVTVNPLPQATVTANGPTTFCAGDSVMLSASTGLGYIYQWQKDGADLPNANTAGYFASSGGSYTVIVTQNGCSATSIPTAVTVQTVPPATITTNGPASFCTGSSVMLMAPSNATYMYQWQYNGADLGGLTSVPNLAVPLAGVYAVVVILGNCSAVSPPITVAVVPEPPAVITITGPLSFCAGGSVLLSAPAGAYTYQWKNNGTDIPGATAASYDVVAAGSYSVVVSQNGCSATSPPVNVSMVPPPNAVISASGPTTTCANSNLSLIASAGAGYTYQWQKDGVVIPGATAGSYVPVASGNYAVIVSQSTCSSTSLPVTVILNPVPVPDTLVRTICTGDTAWLGNTAYTLPGTYSQTLPANNGCDSVVTLMLTVTGYISQGKVATICAGDVYNFNGKILSQPGVYQDTLPGGANGCDTLITLLLNGLSPVYQPRNDLICPKGLYHLGDSTFTKPGNYQVVLPVGTAGCDTIVLLDLDVFPLSLSLGEDRHRCADGPAVDILPDIKACPGCDYKWSTGATTAQISVMPEADTAYALTITDQNQCVVTDTVRVQVDAPYFNQIDTFLCPPAIFLFDGDTIFTSGTYEKTYSSIAGCDSTVLFNLQFLQPGLLKAVTDTFLLPPDELVSAFRVTHNDALGTGWRLLVQEPPLFGDADTLNRDEIRYIRTNAGAFGYDSLLYFLCPEDCPDLCDSARVYIFLQGASLDQVRPLIPNIITPNGDGFNDTFDPVKFLDDLRVVARRESTELYIFNRWGEVVFRASSYPEGGWDGSGRSGKILPPAAYYYRLVLDVGTKEILDGSVVLLK